MDFLKNAKRLPVLDWNLTFFGAHEQTVSSTWKVPLEKHYAFECIFVIEGAEQISLQNNTYVLNPGDFFLIPPEFSHEVKAVKKLTYFCFHFDLDDPSLKIQLIQGVKYYNPKFSYLCKKITPQLETLDSLIDTSSFNFDTKMIIQISLSKILQSLYEFSITNTHGKSTSGMEYSRQIADYLKSQLTNQVLSYVKKAPAMKLKT